MLPFVKMHGAGNDYVYVDTFDSDWIADLPIDLPELARQISHRRFGVGGDGLIVIHPSDVADARMQMFNADGSESEMCGNGIRCVAKYVHDRGLAKTTTMKIETGNGVLSLDLQLSGDGTVDAVTVDMGPAILDAPAIPTTIAAAGRIIDHPIDIDGQTLRVTCVSMGNPHCVIFVDDATDELVLQTGPKIETDPRFPNRVNVEFVEVVSPTEVRQRTWERGSGETWACGTGASAVAVAGVLTGRTEPKILNHLVGGDLTLHYDGHHVHMTGGAIETFQGIYQVQPQRGDIR